MSAHALDVEATPAFADTLRQRGVTIARHSVHTVQVNLGKRCNQACHHCHVDAGPLRTEAMSAETLDRLVHLLERSPTVSTVDITGGAPELHPHFRDLVRAARALDRQVMDRCNLTVLFEPGQEETAEFLRNEEVQIVASLPCYTKDMLERQRGLGVFDKSIRALQVLNALGYGIDPQAPSLDLVYNPIGPSLPGPQAELEAKYKEELLQSYGIRFNHLYTITNMPIKRFLHQIDRDGQRQIYQRLLFERFNPEAARGVMCTGLVSVAWDGRLFDCDFNQMEELAPAGEGRSLWDIESFNALAGQPIAFANHCYGCTAGAGSSCQGALA